jgi:FKBP-type peptidyl-prolyl cis-trans isomerase FkpA
MKMHTLTKTMLSVAVAFGLAGLACAQGLDSDEAKESYSLGASLGNYVSSQIYKQTQLGAPVNMDLVVQGLTDALKNKSQLKDDEILQQLNARAERLNKLAEAELDKMRAANKKESEAFLAANKAKKGVTSTASGLQYEVIAEGKGNTPKEEDIVTVEYVGKLFNGTEFEGTAKEKKTQQFVVMSLVPGLKEGVSLMKEGSEYRFASPAALAYGADGAGPIPPETALVFDVKLVKIEKPGAHSKGNPHAGMPGMPGMQGMPKEAPEGQSGKKAWPHG